MTSSGLRKSSNGRSVGLCLGFPRFRLGNGPKMKLTNDYSNVIEVYAWNIASTWVRMGSCRGSLYTSSSLGNTSLRNGMGILDHCLTVVNPARGNWDQALSAAAVVGEVKSPAPGWRFPRTPLLAQSVEPRLRCRELGED